MTMPGVQTVQSGMQAAANEFGNRATEFNGYLRTVNTDMATLQASWTGQASTAFDQAMDNWESSFQSIINQLLHIMDVMGANTSSYRSAEDDASNIAQSFSSALPGV